MSVRLLHPVLFIAVLLSAGCASLEPLLASLTPPSTAPPTHTPQPSSTPPLPATVTPPAAPEVEGLRIWLPAQFNPSEENPAAELLAERLAEFQTRHPDLKLDVRIKQAEADGDMLEALSITGKAAPAALPDLILLSRPDLEVAALLGLLHPIDGLSTALDDPNWYSYARQLAHIQNTAYGLPVLGDALIFVYYPELGQIVTWEDVLASEGDLVFSAGNLQALAGLSLYASAGGELLSTEGLPTLGEAALLQVLRLVDAGLSAEIIPPSLVNVTNEVQVLQIYRTGSANKGIVWYLSHNPSSDGAVIPMPGLGEMPFSYATGWIWALAGADPQHQPLAMELAEYLAADEFLEDWTRQAGYLPTRPSLVGEDRTLTAILESAHPIPARDVLAVLGPLMQEALTRVLNGEEPEDVAASIVEKLR